VSTGCVSGCMCPDGLLADGNGGCVRREKCSCTHNGISYSPGDQVQQDCNKWWARHPVIIHNPRCYSLLLTMRIIVKKKIGFMFNISAHAQMGCGVVQKRNAMAPVPSMVKVISRLLMAGNIPSTETVNTS